MNYGMFRGDSLILNVLVQQLTDPLSPPSVSNPYVPVDLTGAKLWMTAKKKLTDTDLKAVFQITSPGDITIDAIPTSGRAKVTVPASATTAVVFPADTAQLDLYYDIQVKTSTGIVQTVASGKLTLTEDVTDAIV